MVMETIRISKSAKRVYNILQSEGKLKSKEIHELMPTYTDRTVRNALKRLKELKLITIECDLEDMRIRYYYCASA